MTVKISSFFHITVVDETVGVSHDCIARIIRHDDKRGLIVEIPHHVYPEASETMVLDESHFTVEGTDAEKFFRLLNYPYMVDDQFKIIFSMN